MNRVRASILDGSVFTGRDSQVEIWIDGHLVVTIIGKVEEQKGADGKNYPAVGFEFTRNDFYGKIKDKVRINMTKESVLLGKKADITVSINGGIHLVVNAEIDLWQGADSKKYPIVLFNSED